MFWTCGDSCPGFKIQEGCAHLYTSSPEHYGIIRFICGASPASALAGSMAAESLLAGTRAIMFGLYYSRLDYSGPRTWKLRGHLLHGSMADLHSKILDVSPGPIFFILMQFS